MACTEIRLVVSAGTLGKHSSMSLIREAHNPKVAGSNPAPATNKFRPKSRGFGLFLYPIMADENAPENDTSGHDPTPTAGTQAGTPSFRLRPVVPTGPLHIAIKERDYRETLIARQMLLTAVAIEQKFWLLVDNFEDYERGILTLALEKHVRPDFGWRVMQTDALDVNRRLMNYLTSSRMYVDQVMQDLSLITGPDGPAELRSKMSAEYDARLGYRVMEALRNVVQHSTLAVTGVHFPHVSEGSISAAPTMSAARLREAGLKGTVADELEALSDMYPVSPFVREYMEGLGAVHQTARALMKPKVTPANELVKHWLSTGAAVWPNMIGFFMSASPEAEGFQLFDELPKYWEWLVKNNHTMGGIGKTFVTGKSLPLR